MTVVDSEHFGDATLTVLEQRTSASLKSVYTVERHVTQPNGSRAGRVMYGVDGFPDRASALEFGREWCLTMGGYENNPEPKKYETVLDASMSETDATIVSRL
jgi:hypothetical protein